MILLKVTTAIHTYVHAVVVLRVRESGVDVVSMRRGCQRRGCRYRCDSRFDVNKLEGGTEINLEL